MAKGGRPVALEAEVPEPREAVAADTARASSHHGSPVDEQRQHAQHRAPGADVMQRARHRVAVLAQIEGIELREAAEARILWAR